MMMEEAAGNVITMEKSLLEYVRKSTPPPFLMKTYMLVEDPATNDVVSWNSDGSAFVVWQPAEFSRDLLPTLFKHSNFSSFVRQLNTYGFRKVATTRWEFCNDMFRKGKRELLCEIRRRKAWTNKLQPNKVAQNQTVVANDNESLEEEEEQRSSSTSSSCGYSSLVDENKRLKKENGVLSSELMSMKMKCKELFDLVAKYHNNNRPEKEDEEGDDEGPKLFGVRLEVQGELKRKRSREIGEGGSKILLSQSCK